MKATMIFTGQGHDHAVKELFPTLYVPGAEELTAVETGTTGFYGFGVAITPSSCYELNRMDPAERKALLRSIYTKEGIGLSIARLCIGSSDYSAEIYSYDDMAFDTELAHFSVERDEAYVIPMIKEILEINPDLYLYASPWSPPYWMKTGGCMCGGYMREEYLECYADYIIKFVEAYAAHGIKVSGITPQNEPNTQQNGKMPACIWHPELEAKFIGILRAKCVEKGLDLKIWMHDHNFSDVNRVLWSLANCKGLKESCDGVAFHYYEGTVEQTKAVGVQYPELELHFTEGGPRLTDHYDTDWCKWGTIVLKTLKAGYRSFTGWNLMLDECGGPNVGPFIGICGGLVTHDNRTEELRYSGQYKAFSHIAPYITREAMIYPILQSETAGWMVSRYPKYDFALDGVLIDQQNGKKVAVLVNPNDHGVQAQLKVDDTLWYVELLADSIATIVIEE